VDGYGVGFQELIISFGEDNKDTLRDASPNVS